MTREEAVALLLEAQRDALYVLPLGKHEEAAYAALLLLAARGQLPDIVDCVAAELQAIAEGEEVAE